MKSRNTLKKNQFWTSERKRCRFRECGSRKGGGSRRDWSWWGRGRYERKMRGGQKIGREHRRE